MSYQKNWVASPNYTPASQTQAAYGRPRSIQGGAGHWWNWPRSGASHDGIVSYMANAARQAAPHAVLSAGRVTEMVRDQDTAWCTANANPITFAIEIDPRIMFRWGYDNPSQAEKDLGNQIFETLCEYIADKGYHNLPWKPHNVWAPGTQCNPIPYDDVMRRAKEYWNAKHTNPSKPVPGFTKLSEGKLTMRAMLDKVEVWDLTTNPNYKSVKTLNKNDTIDVVAFIDFNNTRYYVTQYSVDNGKKVGVNRNDVSIVVPEAQKPEWQRNIRDIEPIKLMVLAAQTPILNLNDLSVIKQLGQGTWVDFTKSTTVNGKEYLISSYSAANAMPNGIARVDVGVPVVPPVNEKPAWLEKWEDIVDVDMYARADTDLVDFKDGKTLKVIPRGEKIEVASVTELHGVRYAITKYSTEKKFAQGIRIDDLDLKPINPDPVEPAPNQPTIEDRLNWLEKAVNAILKFLGLKV